MNNLLPEGENNTAQPDGNPQCSLAYYGSGVGVSGYHILANDTAILTRILYLPKVGAHLFGVPLSNYKNFLV